MSLAKRWRGLSHQIRVTVISTVAATVVLGMVLAGTGFMLVKNASDTALRQTNVFIDASLHADKDRTMDDIVDRYNRRIQRGRDRAAGIPLETNRPDRG